MALPCEAHAAADRNIGKLKTSQVELKSGTTTMLRTPYKSLIGATFILFSVVMISFLTSKSSADEQVPDAKQELASKLTGTWKLVSATNPGSPSGIGTRLKMFTGTHWCVLQPDADGKIVFQHGGTYEFDGTEITTKTDFAGESTAMFIGREATVKLVIEDDVLKQVDRKGAFNETWRREPKPAAKRQ